MSKRRIKKRLRCFMPGDRGRLNSASGLIGSAIGIDVGNRNRDSDAGSRQHKRPIATLEADIDTDSDGIWKLNEFFVKGYL